MNLTRRTLFRLAAPAIITSGVLMRVKPVELLWPVSDIVTVTVDLRSADEILNDINMVLNQSWANYSLMPNTLMVPPEFLQALNKIANVDGPYSLPECSALQYEERTDSRPWSVVDLLPVRLKRFGRSRSG